MYLLPSNNWYKSKHFRCVILMVNKPLKKKIFLMSFAIHKRLKLFVIKMFPLFEFYVIKLSLPVKTNKPKTK